MEKLIRMNLPQPSKTPKTTKTRVSDRISIRAQRRNLQFPFPKPQPKPGALQRAGIQSGIHAGIPSPNLRRLRFPLRKQEKRRTINPYPFTTPMSAPMSNREPVNHRKTINPHRRRFLRLLRRRRLHRLHRLRRLHPAIPNPTPHDRRSSSSTNRSTATGDRC